VLMVIFGAGASWDSYERLPPPNVNNLRLPLANRLFDSRFGNYYRLFPKCQPLIQRLQRQDVNVENVLGARLAGCRVSSLWNFSIGFGSVLSEPHACTMSIRLDRSGH